MVFANHLIVINKYACIHSEQIKLIKLYTKRAVKVIDDE